jgi:predicted secreted hydrolase
MLKLSSIPLLVLTLVGCEESQPQGFGSWLGEDSGTFTEVTPETQLRFPEDHQSHEDYRHEWWYFTANLVTSEGEKFGVQWTQFRIALASNDSKHQGWETSQLYMAHSAITNSTHHLAAEKWSRAHPEMAGVTMSPFHVFLDDWQWRSNSDEMFPASLNVVTDEFSYSLDLVTESPFQLQGVQGYSVKSADGSVASHYYSQPFIDVEGTITFKGEQHKVTGQGWIDREWSSQFLLGSQQGWDWFALRLDEDMSLVVFQLRDSETGDANYAYGQLMRRGRAGISISSQEITLKALDTVSIQGADYPTVWQLEIPEHQIALTIEALNPLAKMPLSVPYWEGSVTIEGTHQGSGYMELTGY